MNLDTHKTVTIQVDSSEAEWFFFKQMITDSGSFAGSPAYNEFLTKLEEVFK